MTNPDNQPVELLPCPSTKDIRRAYEASIRGRFEETAHLFRLSETGQAYASPWVQAEFGHFAAGYRAAHRLNTRAAPPADARRAKMIAGLEELLRVTKPKSNVARLYSDTIAALRHTDNPRTDERDATIAELTKDRDYYAERYANGCGQLIVHEAEKAALKMAVEAEREACAKVAELFDDGAADNLASLAARVIAAAIRSHQQSLGVDNGER